MWMENNRTTPAKNVKKGITISDDLRFFAGVVILIMKESCFHYILQKLIWSK